MIAVCAVAGFRRGGAEPGEKRHTRRGAFEIRRRGRGRARFFCTLYNLHYYTRVLWPLRCLIGLALTAVRLRSCRPLLGMKASSGIPHPAPQSWNSGATHPTSLSGGRGRYLLAMTALALCGTRQ